MASIHTKIKLIYGDPPDPLRIVYGVVLRTFRSIRSGNYLLIQEAYSSLLFIVTNRHGGFDVSNPPKKGMMVAIFIAKEPMLSFESLDLTSHLPLFDYKIGSLEIIDDFPEEFHRK